MGADISLLPLREVCARVGLSAATVYRLLASDIRATYEEYASASVKMADALLVELEAK